MKYQRSISTGRCSTKRFRSTRGEGGENKRRAGSGGCACHCRSESSATSNNNKSSNPRSSWNSSHVRESDLITEAELADVGKVSR